MSWHGRRFGRLRSWGSNGKHLKLSLRTFSFNSASLTVLFGLTLGREGEEPFPSAMLGPISQVSNPIIHFSIFKHTTMVWTERRCVEGATGSSVEVVKELLWTCGFLAEKLASFPRPIGAGLGVEYPIPCSEVRLFEYY